MSDDFDLATPEFLKRWRDQSRKEYDLRTPEGQMAEFGDAVMVILSDHWQDDDGGDPLASFFRLIYVPGDWYCPECKFILHQRTLYAKTGDVGVNHAKPDNCPNDGSEMRKLTYMQDAQAANQMALDLLKENRRLRERLAELEPRN